MTPSGSTLRFVKMEGAGNDYIFVDGVHQEFDVARGPELARRWSRPHFGIGADGLIVMVDADAAACRMLMWNADGSRGAMCGNGLRCLAVLAWSTGVASSTSFLVATDAGPRGVEVVLENGEPIAARIDMGRVAVAADAESIHAAGGAWEFFRGDAGNPHAIVFVDRDPMTLPLEEVGTAFQADKRFPDGVNVEFAHVRADGSLFQRTWERGSGETLACGTGASAVAQAALSQGRVPGPEVMVHLRGGQLRFAQNGPSLVMEGPARTVFHGEIPLGPHP